LSADADARILRRIYTFAGGFAVRSGARPGWKSEISLMCLTGHRHTGMRFRVLERLLDTAAAAPLDRLRGPRASAD
jgi:hypothetical protein